MKASAALPVPCSRAGAGRAPQPPSIVGRSWMLGDLSSGQILAAQKADERIEPASLTKLMTAYVVFAGAARQEAHASTSR